MIDKEAWRAAIHGVTKSRAQLSNWTELKHRQKKKKTVTEIKNTLEAFNSRISEAEGRISELEDKMLEITSEKQNKVKRMKSTEDSLRDLWDNIQCTNIWTIGVPE